MAFNTIGNIPKVTNIKFPLARRTKQDQGASPNFTSSIELI